MLRCAVIQKLGTMGEAAAHVSVDVTTRYPEVPWPRIVAFRNTLIHTYFRIDWEVARRVAVNRCPDLREQIGQHPRGGRRRTDGRLRRALTATTRDSTPCILCTRYIYTRFRTLLDWITNVLVWRGAGVTTAVSTGPGTMLA
jgi:hypothetical protein